MVKSRIYFASRDVSVSLVSAFSPPTSLLKHLLIKSWHSGDNFLLNSKVALQIWWSFSQGMSPQTMS